MMRAQNDVPARKTPFLKARDEFFREGKDFRRDDDRAES
jgi:hypothetical protein